MENIKTIGINQQEGSGIPTHNANINCKYTDISNGYKYINTGKNKWVNYAFESGEIITNAGIVKYPNISLNNTIINISESIVNLYSTVDKTGVCGRYNIDSQNIKIESDSTLYLIADYNNGIPIYKFLQKLDDVNESNILYISTIIIEKINDKFILNQLNLFKNLDVNVSINKNLNILVNDSIKQIIYYYKDNDTWKNFTSNTLDTMHFCKSTLLDISDNNYSINWIYVPVCKNDVIYAILGQDDYVFSDLKNIIEPDKHPFIDVMCFLSHSIIIKKGSTSLFDIKNYKSKKNIHKYDLIHEHDDAHNIQGNGTFHLSPKAASEAEFGISKLMSEIIGNYSGFINKNDSNIIIDDRVSVVSSNKITYYYNSEKIIVDNIKSIELKDIISFDGFVNIFLSKDGYLTLTTDIIPVCCLYINKNKIISISDIRRNVTAENNFNLKSYVTGLEVNADYSINKGILNTDGLNYIIPNTKFNLPLFYINDNDWIYDEYSEKTFKYIDNIPSYNNNGKQEKCKNNTFVNYYMFATTDIINSIILVQGTVNYGTILQATNNIKKELNDMKLPFKGYLCISAIILKTDNTKVVLNAKNISDIQTSHDDSIITVGLNGCDFDNMNEAVDYFNNSSKNMIIKLKPGIHKVSNTLKINSSYTLLLEGAGNENTFLAPILNNINMFDIYSNITIKNITCDGSFLTNYGTIENESCLKIYSGKCILRDVKINNFYDNTLNTLHSYLEMYNSEISNCINGILLNGGNIITKDSIFKNNKTSLYIKFCINSEIIINSTLFNINKDQLGIMNIANTEKCNVFNQSNNIMYGEGIYTSGNDLINVSFKQK